MPGLDPWPRQLQETPRSYALFASYRDAGPAARSLARVAREFGRSIDAVEQLSRRHSWVARVTAWDAENERVKRVGQVAELEAMARRQVLAGQLFQGRGLKRIQAIADKEIGQLSISEAIRLVEAGFRLERLGRGEPFDLAQTPIDYDIGDASAEALIIDILRRHPSRVGPVVTALSELRDLLGEPAFDDAAAATEEGADLSLVS